MFTRFVSCKLALGLWVTLLAAPLNGVAQAPAESVALRVATFNLRFASDKKPNS